GKPLATRMARFGINLASSGGKRRPPLLSARTDSLRQTDEPNELVAPYHDRMPVVLGDVEGWLNLDTTLDDVNPLGPERFAVRAVNSAVNKVSEKNIDAIERAA